MSASETEELDSIDATELDSPEGEEPVQPLNLDVQVTSPSSCERHVTVTVAREDIDRYFDKAFSDMMPSAAVPGFRAGRAPRKIVEQRYKKEVADSVKGSLLMDSLSQISESQDFAAISEPDLKVEAVEIPDEGPLTFEFDIEVRPDFALPKWKGLKLERIIHTFTDADVEEQIEKTHSRYGQLAPHDGPAAVGDYVTVNITCTHNGEVVESDTDRVVRIREELSLIDGQIKSFAKEMTGVKEGDRRKFKVTLSQDAPNTELRGKEVEIEFEVLEVKHLKLPDLTPEFLKELGQFPNEEAYRMAVKDGLQRQLEYAQQQKARKQITALLTESATWELPPGLLKRQSSRELERAVMELRRAGFSEGEIRAQQNLLRQNSAASTAKALKEHFILERIAEEEKIDVEEGDYEREIFLIAMQSGESPRRVRAQLEKRGLMDVLRNQIIERKVLELVQSEAQFKDVAYKADESNVEAIHFAAGGGGESVIPEATEEVETE